MPTLAWVLARSRLCETGVGLVASWVQVRTVAMVKSTDSRAASFPCDGEVGDLAVDARVVCGYDALWLGVHCVACAGCVACEDGVGSVGASFAASAGLPVLVRRRWE